jgi:hypothetical protein
VTTLRALLYADVRSFVNQLHEIRRSPTRAVMWTFFALIVAGFIVLRVVRAARRQGLPVNIFPVVDSTDVIVCGGILIFGVTLAFGSRFAGLFAHPAEARFIIDSPAKPFVATLYVQAREVVRSGGRQGLGLLYAALFYLPEHLGAGELVRDLILLVVAFMAIGATPLARQLLAKAAIPFAVAVGWILIAGAALPLAHDAAIAFQPQGTLAIAALALPGYHPGAVLLATPLVQIAAIASLLACTAALFIFVARAARDAYPELYELSMKRFNRVERLRGRFFTAASAAPATTLVKRPVSGASATGAAPGGVTIFVWRAWTEYRHTHNARATGLETALMLGGGYALARLTAFAHPELVISIASPFVTLLFLLALAKSAALGNELRRPLFWLSDTTLFERLGALAVAQSWRVIGWFELLAVGLGAGHAPLVPIVAAALTGPAAVLLAIATGYASYALFPSEVDQRGPLLFVRLILGYALLTPALVVGVLCGFLVHRAIFGFATGTATALLEAAVLIGFAAWRLDRMSISLR